ncbi:MAG: LysR substrate-binding domain-containing protein [Bilophila wadsworthia]
MVFPVASGILFADLLSKYRQLYPGINISLQEQGCASLEPMVLSGDLDLAVTLLPVPPNFSWLQIRDEPLMVIMPPDHPLADRKRLKMDELADNAFIGFEQGFLLNDRIKAVCRQRGLKLNECLRSGQLDFIMTLVATGIGVALLPRLELERRNSTSTSPFSTKRNSVGAPPSSGGAGPSCPPPRRRGSTPRRRGSAGKRKARMTASGAEADRTGHRKVRHRRLPKDATFSASKPPLRPGATGSLKARLFRKATRISRQPLPSRKLRPEQATRHDRREGPSPPNGIYASQRKRSAIRASSTPLPTG